MANISTLTVSLVADTAKFSSGLKKGRKQAANFAKAAKAAAKVAAAAFAGMGVAIGALVVESLKLVDQQRKIARVLGTSQATFAGLSLAAGISGLTIQSFTKALKRQQKSIVDANDGLQTQARAFKRLKLNTEDLINLPVEQQFALITKRLGEVENATIKVGIASDIFGAKNADLINVIDLGADGLQKYIDLSKTLGLALTDNQTDKIEEANDQWLIFKSSITGLGNQMAASLSPAITAVANVLTGLVTSITDSLPAFSAWATGILGVERALNSLTIRELDAEIKQIDIDMRGMLDDLDDLRDALKDPAIVAQFGSAFQTSEIEKLETELIRLAERFKEAGAERDKLRKSGEVASSGTAVVDTEGFGGLNSFTARARSDLDGVNALLAESTAIFDEWQRAAESAFDKSRSPVEAFNIEVEKIRSNPFIDGDLQQRAIDDAIKTLHAGLESIKADVESTSTEMSEFSIQAFRNMETALADALFKPWGEGLDGMVKGLRDALRKMLADLVASKILNFLSGIFGGGFGTGTPKSTPGRALGGPVGAGQSVRVHEGEIFTPGASGRISQLGSVAIKQENNFIGGDSLTIATLIPLLEENNRKLKGELADEIDRGLF